MRIMPPQLMHRPRWPVKPDLTPTRKRLDSAAISRLARRLAAARWSLAR